MMKRNAMQLIDRRTVDGFIWYVILDFFLINYYQKINGVWLMAVLKCRLRHCSKLNKFCLVTKYEFHRRDEIISLRFTSLFREKIGHLIVTWHCLFLKVLQKRWRLLLNAHYGGPNVCKVSCVSTMSRLADYFVVVGYDYDYDKECMYRAFCR